MEDRFRKISCITSSEISPPILLRRRLSVPETIMRKHTLAQQRSSSQDSDRSHLSDSTQSCNWPLDAGSDLNLNKRKDPDIRKSTLMKRFWESSKTLQFPRTYSEWQYSFGGKMKAGSSHTTPEHLRGSRKNIFEMSPKHRRISPKHEKYDHISPKRKVSVYSGNYSETKIGGSPKHRRSHDAKSDVASHKELEDSYVIYSSNFSNATDTVSNSTPTEDQSTPGHSDSIYTNSFPSFIPTSSDSNGTTYSNTVKAYQINSNSMQSVSQIDKIPECPIKYEFVIHENNEDNKKSYEFIPTEHKTSSTQTNETTNLNVISNVHLSQSTLNLIFNKVMQDVLQIQPDQATVIQPQVINVQNLPKTNFNVSKTEESKKNPISQINAGSPYKTKESPLVPRLSALPRSTSMEVNISSNESFEKESDSGSLVDSLEDPSSPKETKFSHDDKLVRGQLALLPDNSDNPKPAMPPLKKSSVFYIPIKNDELKAISEESKTETVSSLLPDKLKEKLLKRQLMREEKKKENRLNSFQNDNENGNIHPYFMSSPDIAAKPKNKKKRNTLPQIDNKIKEKHDSKNDRNFKSSYTQRSLNKYRESLDTHNQAKSFWLPKPRQQNKPKAEKEASTSKNHYHQKPDSKQIEILEIMEIVEPERIMQHLQPKVKSKIPVLVQQKLPKIQKETKSKAPYLNYETDSDPKLDQLIANILIDSLNRDDQNDNYKFCDPIPEEKIDTVNNNPKLIDKAADLLTKQVLENNNLDQNYIKSDKLDDDKSSVDPSNIPKGWITFYMLQKNNSPDSTSDEGRKAMSTKLSKSTQFSAAKSKNGYSRFQSKDYYESDTDSERKKQKQSRRNMRNNKANQRGWSVTVSGNTRGDLGPDVEMRLKFPQVNEKPAAKTRTTGTQGVSQSFPELKRPKQQNTESGFTFEEVCANRQTSEMNKSKLYFKNCESTTQRSSVYPAKIEPRSTKTSKQRCMISRSINRPYQELLSPIKTNHRDLQDILGKFPEILAVNGNAVNRGNKQILPKMSERDLKKFLSQFHNPNLL